MQARVGSLARMKATESHLLVTSFAHRTFCFRLRCFRRPHPFGDSVSLGSRQPGHRCCRHDARPRNYRIQTRRLGKAVNVTWGLSYLRTSVDHGVAYEAARSGKADFDGMLSALEMAYRLS